MGIIWLRKMSARTSRRDLLAASSRLHHGECAQLQRTITSQGSLISPRFASTWQFPPPVTPPSTEDLHQHGLPFLLKAQEHAEDGRMCLSSKWPDSDNNNAISYEVVLRHASQVASFLLELPEKKSSRFVANLCLPGADYVSATWGTWAAGYAAVPLALSYKIPELEHVLTDTAPQRILVGEGIRNVPEFLQAAENVDMLDRVTFLKDSVFTYDNIQTEMLLGGNGIVPNMDSPALVVYTSGTTGKAKGVLSTHRNLFHQVTDLVSTWKWQPTDTALHVLPLHHVHGITKLCSAAYVGARLDFQPFDATRLWTQWAEPASSENVKPNVFMAVPTIYAKLLEAAESLPAETLRTAVEGTLRRMRLMVSGSAALPVSSFERWERLTGHKLLERYGMTEFGMSISNPYEPVEERHPGHVGLPLPSVKARLVDEETGTVVDSPGTSGSLRIKGPTVFQEYLNRTDAMLEAFDDDGYFVTGDVAEFNAKLRSYRILGRASVDILKVGGCVTFLLFGAIIDACLTLLLLVDRYKLSALEIERDLLEHPDVAELAIMGVPDEVWGERVGMVCRIKAGRDELTVDSLRIWCEDRMARHKIPSRLLVVDEIPKNAMGKVNKKTLVKLVETDGK